MTQAATPKPLDTRRPATGVGAAAAAKIPAAQADFRPVQPSESHGLKYTTPEPDCRKAEEGEMAYFTVTKRDGTKETLEGVDGWRLMELLRDYKTGVEGICGGQLDCASCHVYVDPDWVDRLPPPRDDEEAKLDELPSWEENSRLSCQIIWGEELDGLAVTVAPD